jgi:TolB-like protein
MLWAFANMVLLVASAPEQPGATAPATAPATSTSSSTSSPSPTEASPSTKSKVEHSIVVLDFSSPKELADKARALTALVTAELGKRSDLKLVTSADVQRMLGLERQKEMLGCHDDSCLAEIGGALGSRYVLSGQLEKFGSKFLLTAGVFDARTATSLVKSAQTAGSEEELPNAALAMARDVSASIGNSAVATAATAPTTSASVPTSTGHDVSSGSVSSTKPAEEPLVPTVGLNLKLGNTLPALLGNGLPQLNNFNLRLDIEGDYFVTPHFLPFLDASLVLAHDSTNQSLQFVPLLLGCKYQFRRTPRCDPTQAWASAWASSSASYSTRPERRRPSRWWGWVAWPTFPGDTSASMPRQA